MLARDAAECLTDGGVLGIEGMALRAAFARDCGDTPA
jgi:hypothetical protein